MYGFVDQGLTAQHPHRTFINEIHLYFDYNYRVWKYYYFEKVIQLDEKQQKLGQGETQQNIVFNKKIKKLNEEKQSYDKIFGILRETNTDKQRLLLRTQSMHATFHKICVK